MLESRSAAARGARQEAAVIPLPPVVDTPAVVLLGMLVGGARPVVLDASAVREVQPTAAPLLDSLLRSVRTARMAGASAALRRRYAGQPLAAWFAAPEPADDELLFVCPDRDETGFTPSPR
jgi:hypothetical protein